MKKWSEIRGTLPPAMRARMDMRLDQAVASMPLDKLRKAQNLTQIAVADKLDIDQGSVSKLENRTDMYLSTLREYIEALGGTLELRAEFPEGTVSIDLRQTN